MELFWNEKFSSIDSIDWKLCAEVCWSDLDKLLNTDLSFIWMYYNQLKHMEDALNLVIDTTQSVVNKQEGDFAEYKSSMDKMNKEITSKNLSRDVESDLLWIWTNVTNDHDRVIWLANNQVSDFSIKLASIQTLKSQFLSRYPELDT